MSQLCQSASRVALSESSSCVTCRLSTRPTTCNRTTFTLHRQPPSTVARSPNQFRVAIALRHREGRRQHLTTGAVLSFPSIRRRQNALDMDPSMILDLCVMAEFCTFGITRNGCWTSRAAHSQETYLASAMVVHVRLATDEEPTCGLEHATDASETF